jgi:hypothetical protein
MEYSYFLHRNVISELLRVIIMRNRIRTLLLPCLLCLSCTLRGQPRPVSGCYWIDSFNLRLHLSYYLLGNGLQDVQYQTGDPAYDVRSVFRHQAYAPIRGKTVHVKLVKKSEHALDIVGLEPAAVSAALAGFADAGQVEQQQWLRYDAEGYLVERIVKDEKGDSLYFNADTTRYVYVKRADGSLQVNVSEHSYSHNRHKKPPRGYGFFYSSIYSGTFRKGPLTRHGANTTTYEFNSAGKPLSVVYDYKQWVNGIADYDTNGKTIRLFRYDDRGRLLNVRDSLPALGLNKTEQRYEYSDAVRDAWPPMRIPKMRQFISAIDPPHAVTVRYTSTNWNRDVGNGYYPRDSGRTNKETYYTVCDAAGRLHLSQKMQPVSEEPVLYVWGTDSIGDYRMRCQVYASVDDTAAAVYNPEWQMWPVTEQHGCIIETYYPQPPGTFTARSLECSDRSVVNGTDGWRMICYGPYGNTDIAGSRTYFPPIHQKRFIESRRRPVNFILVDKEGLIRYSYDQDFLYSVEYE